MTHPTNEQNANFRTLEQKAENTQVQTVEVIDPIFEETYTAHITKKLSKWHGWILDVSEVACEAKTKKELLKTLTVKLHEVLVAEEEKWEKKFEADVKAGKLDKLREGALEDVQAGRFKYL